MRRDQFDPAVVDALVAIVTEALGVGEPGWQLEVAPPAEPAALPAPVHGS